VLQEIEIWKEAEEDRDLEYLLAAVKLALDDSGLKYNRENNNIGLFITDEHPNFEPFCERIILETLAYLKNNLPTSKKFSKKKLLEYLYKKCVKSGYNLQTFMYLHLVAKAFGFHGFSLYNNNACASGLFALESAARQIKYGGSTIAIVAGGDYPVNIYKYLWFKEQNLYAQDGKIKPFSKDANGIVFGDGASAIVLEDLEHAQKRDAHIYAEYLGSGFHLEGWKVVIPDICGDSYYLALKEALENSNVKPSDVDLINPHGVGIKITDTYEAKAINRIFGTRGPLVTAFKPYVGHNLGGSALIETIILLLSLQNNFIPPTLNSSEIFPNTQVKLVTEKISIELKTVMKMSCGFAGYNGVVVFKKLDNNGG
jgi:3-oxoacyl-[acyl-carrier-protein] synthase II